MSPAPLKLEQGTSVLATDYDAAELTVPGQDLAARGLTTQVLVTGMILRRRLAPGGTWRRRW
jgi:hypothetical protein